MKSSTKSRIGFSCMVITGVIYFNAVVYLMSNTTKSFIVTNSALLLIGLYAFGAWLFINNNTD